MCRTVNDGVYTDTPRKIYLVIDANIAPGPGGCEDCDNLWTYPETPFVLPFWRGYLYSGHFWCVYRYTYAEGFCEDGFGDPIETLEVWCSRSYAPVRGVTTIWICVNGPPGAGNGISGPRYYRREGFAPVPYWDPPELPYCDDFGEDNPLTWTVYSGMAGEWTLSSCIPGDASGVTFDLWMGD
jgi:hypothetical protein